MIPSNQEQIVIAIHNVEHPAISMSLVDLGMVRDIQVKEKEVTMTFVLPFSAIPQAVRDHIINSLRNAVTATGGTVKDVKVEVMTDEERQSFLQKEQANWKG